MKSETGEKPFDCVKWTRKVRDRINAEIKDMSYEEERRYFNRRPTNSFLAEFFDRLKTAKTLQPSAHGAECRAASGRLDGARSAQHRSE